MPFFSLSLRKPGRVGEPKTTFNAGELPPTPGQAIELRVADGAYPTKLAFWADLSRLLQRMRELSEPRPEFAGPAQLNAYLLENGADLYVLEDGSGFYALE